MGQKLLRLAVFVTGIALMLIGLVALTDPARVAAGLGITSVNLLGAASLRADLFGFFTTAGILSFLAAVRRMPELLMAPLLLMALALTGRVVALFVVPFDVTLLPPMAAEAVMTGLFGAARFLGMDE
jgi:hypothetical protein